MVVSLGLGTMDFLKNKEINSLTHWGPVRPYWRYKTWSTLVQAMACWLTAPSHYMNWCWLSSTRTTRTPPPPHDYSYHWVILDPKSKEDKVKVTNLKNSPNFQIFQFWNKHHTRHTFWSCSKRCANMKWIRWVLLKIQNRHDSVHRRTSVLHIWYSRDPL